MKDPFGNFEPNLKPARLAELTGLSADMQRDWRRRTYIPEGIGTLHKNGYWLYDWHDALYIACVVSLQKSGIEIKVSQRIVSVSLGYIALAAQYRFKIISFKPAYRLLQVFKHPAAEGERYGGWATQPIKRIEDKHPAPSIILVDVYDLACTLHGDFYIPFLQNYQATEAACKSQSQGEV